MPSGDVATIGLESSSVSRLASYLAFLSNERTKGETVKKQSTSNETEWGNSYSTQISEQLKESSDIALSSLNKFITFNKSHSERKFILPSSSTEEENVVLVISESIRSLLSYSELRGLSSTIDGFGLLYHGLYISARLLFSSEKLKTSQQVVAQSCEAAKEAILIAVDAFKSNTLEQISIKDLYIRAVSKIVGQL